MEEKKLSEVQDLLENRICRMGAKLKSVGVLIQGEAESSIILNEDERIGLGWMIEDMGTELRSIADKGVDLCFSEKSKLREQGAG